MDERDDPLQLQHFKGVVPYRVRRFRRQPAIPAAGIEPVANLYLAHVVHRLAKKAAVTNQSILFPQNDRKLARQTLSCRSNQPLEKKTRGRFPREDAGREPHEIGIGRQFGERLEVCLHEMAQAQARGFDHYIRSGHESGCSKGAIRPRVAISSRARKVHAMQAEVAKRYWRNLLQTVLMPKLLEMRPNDLRRC